MTSPPAHTKNPLTIIAIFAAIVEASALASLPFLKDDSQDLYTWFLIGFPPFLTLLFFVTLNFNYKVLYSPSDFSNENDFMQIAKGPIAEGSACTHAPPAAETPVAPPVAPVPPPPSPAQAPPAAPLHRQRVGESKALYILDCQHFATEEEVGGTISQILCPERSGERHLIILYRTSQQLNPMGVLLDHALNQALAGSNECIISAYDLDEAALTTLTRRLTALAGYHPTASK